MRTYEYGSPEFRERATLNDAMSRRPKTKPDYHWLIVIGITFAALGVGVLVVVGIVAAVKADNKAAAEFKSRCEAAGGFTLDQRKDTSGYVYGYNPASGKTDYHWQSSSDSWTDCRQTGTGYIIMQRGR